MEADASSASYFVALGALAATRPVRIEGVGASSIQGDIRFVEAAQRMGADVQQRPQLAGGQARRLAACAPSTSTATIPDAAMTLAVMALYADDTTLRNIASWRVKETDRRGHGHRAAQAGRRGRGRP